MFISYYVHTSVLVFMHYTMVNTLSMLYFKIILICIELQKIKQCKYILPGHEFKVTTTSHLYVKL